MELYNLAVVESGSVRVAGAFTTAKHTCITT
jgi:hypothetical protein